jgi:hypothetical protein
MSAGMSNRPIVSHLKLSFLINSPPHPHSPIPPHSLVCNRDTAVPCVCVDCLIGKQNKPTLFKVTKPSSVPYSTPSACAKWAAYPGVEVEAGGEHI